MHMVNEVKFPVLYDSGVTSFIGSAQKDEGEGDAWGAESITEYGQGESISIGDPDVKVSLANCFKSLLLAAEVSSVQ